VTETADPRDGLRPATDASAALPTSTPQLIKDGTYFVHTDRDEIVACGGWSRRNKIYTGSDAGDNDTACSTRDRTCAHARHVPPRRLESAAAWSGQYSPPAKAPRAKRASRGSRSGATLRA